METWLAEAHALAADAYLASPTKQAGVARPLQAAAAKPAAAAKAALLGLELLPLSGHDDTRQQLRSTLKKAVDQLPSTELHSVYAQVAAAVPQSSSSGTCQDGGTASTLLLRHADLMASVSVPSMTTCRSAILDVAPNIAAPGVHTAAHL